MSISLPLHIRQNLRNLGFSDNGILILSYLFYVQRASLKDISRQTSISYSTCQYITTNLVRIGILSTRVQGGTEYFHICTIDQFMSWIDDRKKEINDQYENAKEEMKKFLMMVDESSWKPNVSFYEGVEGIKAIYNDMVSTGEDICAWTDISLIQKTLGQKFLTDYINRRVKKGIKSSSILQQNRVNKSYSKKEQKRETKIVKDLDIEGEIRIFGPKVAVITFDKEELVGFVLESPTVAEMFRRIFQNSWKTQPSENEA